MTHRGTVCQVGRRFLRYRVKKATVTSRALVVLVVALLFRPL